MKIIFTTNNLPFSILIRAMTSCEWSHTAVCFGDAVYEARFGGVSKTTLSEIKSRGKHAVVNVDLPDESAAELFARSSVGAKYDFIGLLGFKFGRDWQDASMWFCSEHTAFACESGKRELVRKGLRGVSPRDLWVLPL